MKTGVPVGLNIIIIIIHTYICRANINQVQKKIKHYIKSLSSSQSSNPNFVLKNVL